MGVFKEIRRLWKIANEDINKLNANQQEQNDHTEDNDSLASDGPVSNSEGDGGADLYETDVIPGSDEVIDDLGLDPDDDLNTNVEQEDLDALEGMDRDDS